eukprot:10612200-Alexandrium_andersonii.AAC.1
MRSRTGVSVHCAQDHAWVARTHAQRGTCGRAPEQASQDPSKLSKRARTHALAHACSHCSHLSVRVALRADPVPVQCPC